MSIWIIRKDNLGVFKIFSVSISIETLFILFGLFLGVLYQFFYGRPHLIALTIMGLGFLLFFTSKVTQFSRGIWVSWGMQGMSANGRLLYVFGYLLMFMGLLLGIGLCSDVF